MIKAVFLDRDGVINLDHGYVHEIDQFEFCNGIFDLLNHLQKLGYALFIITNQSGINRTYFTQDQYNQLTKHMLNTFLDHNIKINKVFMCPHTPEESCDCRKPAPTLVKNAQREFDIDLTQSWFIGDKESDIKCGLNAGITKLIFVKGRYENSIKDIYEVNSLSKIKSIITV